MQFHVGRRRWLELGAGMAGLCAWAIAGAVARGQGAGGRALVVSAAEVPNFHVVYPFLWRGAAPTMSGLRTLKAQGVRTVIDLRISPKKVAAERRFAESLGLRFINLPMSGDPPTARQVETFLRTATSATDQPVFVHCQHGADRTGTMMGIYRERVDGWDFDHAYREMRRYGFDPHWKKLTATVYRYAPSYGVAGTAAARSGGKP